jgi:hypothetical protein
VPQGLKGADFLERVGRLLPDRDDCPSQASVNDTSGAWQAPPASPPASRAALTPANVALWAAASLFAYCVYEQLRFWLYRRADLSV